MAKLRTVEAMQGKLDEAQRANAKHKAVNAALMERVNAQEIQIADIEADLEDARIALALAKGAALSQVEG